MWRHVGHKALTDGIHLLDGYQTVPFRLCPEGGAKEPAPYRLQGRLHLNSTDGIRMAALAGMGIADLPLYLVRRDIDDGARGPRGSSCAAWLSPCACAWPGSHPRTCRTPTEGVLYRVVREHLETFLAHARENSAKPIPKYVEREFREY